MKRSDIEKQIYKMENTITFIPLIQWAAHDSPIQDCTLSCSLAKVYIDLSYLLKLYSANALRGQNRWRRGAHRPKGTAQRRREPRFANCIGLYRISKKIIIIQVHGQTDRSTDRQRSLHN